MAVITKNLDIEKTRHAIIEIKKFIMEHDEHTDEQIREILSLRKVTVIGMSKHSSKAAHYVPKYLSDNGFDITPVNPTSDEILGKKCYDSVLEINEDIDIVNIFKPSDQVLPFVQDAIKKKPKVIWLQEGIHNSEAEELARNEGIKVIFNRCMLAEHKRLLR